MGIFTHTLFCITFLITSVTSKFLINTDSAIPDKTEPLISSNFMTSLQTLIDSRFKHWAVGFQDQIDDLKIKVVGIEPNAKIDVDNKMKDQDEAEVVNEETKFTGMPTSCTDLKLAGHKLNGFYLIKTTTPTSGQATTSKIETVFCNFQPNSTDLKGFETRIGVVDLKTSAVQFHVETPPGANGIPGKKFRFDNERLNVGNGFDRDNQWFLAPYPGTYFFSLSGTKVGNPRGSRVSIFVLLNGKAVSEAISSRNTEYGGFSCQFSRKLNAGDKIELLMNEYHSEKVYISGFTGWMLDQDLAI